MASTKGRKGADWPFVFLIHGLWKFKDEIRSAHCFLVFEGDVPTGDRAALQQGAPPPLAGAFTWASGNLLQIESSLDSFFDSQVWRAYGPWQSSEGKGEADEALDLEEYSEDFELTKREAQMFIDALDAWLKEVHARHPLTLIAGWPGKLTDPWSRWSLEEIPGRVIPRIRDMQRSGRAPSEETKRAGSMERLIAWVVWEAFSAYLEVHDGKKLEAPLKDAMEEVLVASVGYDERGDELLQRLLRHIGRPLKKR